VQVIGCDCVGAAAPRRRVLRFLPSMIRAMMLLRLILDSSIELTCLSRDVNLRLGSGVEGAEAIKIHPCVSWHSLTPPTPTHTLPPFFLFVFIPFHFIFPLPFFFPFLVPFLFPPPPAARTQMLFAHASHVASSFFRSIDWAQLQAGQTPSPIKLDDISDFSPKSTSKSKAQVRALPRDLVVVAPCSFVAFGCDGQMQICNSFLWQAVLDDSGKKPFAAEGLVVENAFKDFDFSRAALDTHQEI
jgi:hypothetical protein